MSHIFNFLENCRNIFWSSCTTFYFHQLCISSGCSIASLSLGLVSVLNFTHSKGCEVVCHCGFNMHFLNWFMILVFTYVLVICTPLVKRLLKLYTIFIWLVFLLSFEISSYSLDTSSLWGMFCKYLFPNLWLVFLFSQGSYQRQKILILM